MSPRWGEEQLLNNLIKNVAIWLVIALVLMTVFKQLSGPQSSQKPMDYSQFIEEVKQGHVAKVTIEGKIVKGTKTTGEKFVSYTAPDLWMVSDLLKKSRVSSHKSLSPGSRCSYSSAYGFSSCVRCRAADAAAHSRSARAGRA